MKTRLAVVVGFLALALGSCSSRSDVLLGRGDGLRLELRLELAPAFAAYTADLAGLGGAGGSIFDVQSIRNSLSAVPGLTVERVEELGRAGLELHARLDDLPAALAARPELAEFLSFQRRGEMKTITARFGTRSMSALMSLLPARLVDLAGLLLPPPDERWTKAEYADYLSWALEEYESRAELGRTLNALFLHLRLRAEGRILGQSGGALRGGAAEFSLPLLEILTADQPRVYSVRYE